MSVTTSASSRMLCYSVSGQPPAIPPEVSDGFCQELSGLLKAARQPASALLVHAENQSERLMKVLREFQFTLPDTAILVLLDQPANDPLILMETGIQDVIHTLHLPERDEWEQRIITAIARKRRESELQHCVWHDTVTGLVNRQYLKERFEHRLKELKGKHQEVALMYLDLDRFYAVNEQYGHFTGDELLRAAAERLMESTRDSDIVARIAGNSFAVIVECRNRTVRVSGIAGKLSSLFQAPFMLGNVEVYITASVGVEFASTADYELSVMLQHGEMAMRQAKASLQLALQRLKPGDRFNITDFDNQHTLLFEQPATVNDASRQQAQDFVDSLQASGGTHMLPALSATLSQHASDGYLRQVIFITDGAVGNENGIFHALHQQRLAHDPPHTLTRVHRAARVLKNNLHPPTHRAHRLRVIDADEIPTADADANAD